MRKFEIDQVVEGTNHVKTLELLQAKAAEGWEPYAVNGCFHYFKREVGPLPLKGSTLESNSEQPIIEGLSDAEDLSPSLSQGEGEAQQLPVIVPGAVLEPVVPLPQVVKKDDGIKNPGKKKK